MPEYLPKMTVSELTFSIKTMIEESFFGLTVEGEISGFKPAPSGHWYFSLKDKEAVINAVIWAGMTRSVGFIPKDGMKVVVTGNISVYPPRGSYQITCTSMRLSGEGDILAELEEKKRRYAALGYFDSDRKKTIPKRPSKVAVITSPTGAALQDILQVTGRRNSSMDIIILPAVVQGTEAASTIAKRINQVNEFCLADVMIVGRGGGSVEDLLPFSDDEVIEAIHNSDIPVISAVGHEIDWAISDFVADLRAPTPSAAAELVCESQDDQMQKVENLVMSMTESISSIVYKLRTRLAAVNVSSMKHMILSLIQSQRYKVSKLASEINFEIDDRLYDCRNRLSVGLSKLEALSPNAVLERGYAIVTDSTGKSVGDIDKLKGNEEVGIRFANGKVKARILEK